MPCDVIVAYHSLKVRERERNPKRHPFMKPYGLNKKIKHNHPDNHPPKGWVNWWESEISLFKSKKSERQKNKKQIKKEI